MQISDFNIGAPDKGLAPSLKDFNTPAPVVSGFNQGTISNMAAHMSLLATPDALLSTYSQITNELNSGSSSVTLNKMLQETNAIDYAANLDALHSVLADPSINADTKAQYVQGFANLTSRPLGSESVYKVTGRAALMAPSDPDNDNDETEQTRFDLGEILDEVDSYNGWVDQQLRVQDNLYDPNFFEQTLNVLEMIIPFMEGAAVAKFKQSFEPSMIGKGATFISAMTFLGENKAQVRDALNRLPLDQKKELAKQVIERVNASGGSITGRPNDLLMMSQLQSYLQNGGYSDEDRFTDNLFSLLDVSMFITPFFKMAKGAKATAETTRRAEEASARLEKAAPDIEKIVEDTNPPIYVNSRGDASDNIFDVAHTPTGPTIYVNPKGQAFEAVDPSVIPTTADMITDKLIEKFNVPKNTPRGDMAGMVDDLGGFDIAPVREDIRKMVGETLTPESFNNPDTVKKIVSNAQDIFKQKAITTPKTFKPTATQLVNRAMVEGNVIRRSVRTTVSPTTVSQTLKDTNPSRARALAQAMINDRSGQISRITYGTSRTEAVANDVLPEVAEAGGTVRNKVELDLDNDLIQGDQASRGYKEFSPAEKRSARNTVIHDFTNVIGLTSRRAMNQIGNRTLGNGFTETDSGVRVSMIYGPKDGGFTSPKNALEKTKFALRKYGVNDDEVTLISKKNTGEYGPPSNEDLRTGNYLVQVNYDYKFSPADPINWSLTDTSKRLRMFDVILPNETGKTGGLMQHVIPHTAIQDKLLLNAASIVADRATKIVNRMIKGLAGDYARAFKKLDSRQKTLVSNYIVEANNKSLKFDQANLQARGFSPEAIETVRKWKKTWDTMYHFENSDLIKTLHNRGYQQFIDSTNNTNFIVKPMGAVKLTDEYNASQVVTNVLRQVGKETVEAFDSQSNKIVKLRRPELEELYNNGGQIGSTRRTIDLGDDHFDYVIIRNKAETSYVRRMRETDQVLNYRDGHYTVYYNQPLFITKKMTKPDGSVYWKAIASSDNLKDANRFVDDLKRTDNTGEYIVRPDVKRGTSQFDDFEWDTMVGGGRTAQRVRGNRLVNASGQQTDLNHIHLESPEESLVKAIRSTAHRVAYRDFLDAAKKRFVSQFDDLLPEQNGVKYFPTSIDQIGENNANISRFHKANATNTWRYINAMESGYANLLDDMSKNFFKTMSNIAGKRGWGWLETNLAKVAQGGPTAWARKKAFRFLLAANPLRQLPVQAMQALPVILATNPLMLLSGRLPAQFILINYLQRGGDVDSFMKIMAKKATGLTTEDARQIAKHYEQSGFEAAVKGHSYIQDDIVQLVDRGLIAKAKSLAAAPIDIMQKYGFEAGENMLMRSVWLSEYDILRRAGTKITPEVLENLNARVRHLTLNMNRAGELPYNQNMFSALMQFFQAPHKAFAQVVIGHNGLTGWDRIRLGSMYVMTYGLGGSFIADYISKLFPQDQEAREAIEGGLFNLLMNKTLSNLYGQEVRTDFSDSLRLLEIPNPIKFIHSMLEWDIPAIVSSSPSAALFFGDNPRITNFFKSLARPFMVPPERSDQEIINAAKSFLSIMSGASNFFKAQYALETMKSMTSSGRVSDFHVNEVEALMKAAGFSTIDELHQYAFDEKSYQASSQVDQDVNTFITEFSKRMAVEGISNDEADYWVRGMQEAQVVFQNNPFYMKKIMEQLEYRMGRGDMTIYNTILRLGGLADEDTLRSLINIAPGISPEDKATMYEFIDSIKGAE